MPLFGECVVHITILHALKIFPPSNFFSSFHSASPNQISQTPTITDSKTMAPRESLTGPMMPMDFLYQLEMCHDIGKDERCMICLEQYNAPAPGFFERLLSFAVRRQPEPEGEIAVRLPCKHVLGYKCLERWILPGEGGHTTCPYVSAR